MLSPRFCFLSNEVTGKKKKKIIMRGEDSRSEQICILTAATHNMFWHMCVTTERGNYTVRLSLDLFVCEYSVSEEDRVKGNKLRGRGKKKLL